MLTWYFPGRHPSPWNTSGNSSRMLSLLMAPMRWTRPNFSQDALPRRRHNFYRPLENELDPFSHAPNKATHTFQPAFQPVFE